MNLEIEKDNEKQQIARFEELVSLADQFHDVEKKIGYPQKKTGELTIVENGIEQVRQGILPLLEKPKELYDALIAVA